MKNYFVTLTIILLFFLNCFFVFLLYKRTINVSSVIPSFASFTCKSLNNLTETYQLDCQIPVDKTPFVFKDHLNCQALTNHQMLTNRDNKSYRQQITIIKSDYLKFTLDFKGKELVRSLHTGGIARKEHYTITKNANGVIQAMRPIKEKSIEEEIQYEMLTFSKNTGHGMEVWHNVPSKDPHESWRQDSIGSYFFRCY